MTFDDTIVLRNHILALVGRRLPPGRVVEYEMAGGQQVANPWEVAGFFSEIAAKGRVVAEAFFLAGRQVCLLRVYREEPLLVLASVLVDRIVWEEVAAAAEVFLAALESEQLLGVAEARQHLRNSGLPDIAERVLYPLPPPIPPEAV